LDDCLGELTPAFRLTVWTKIIIDPVVRDTAQENVMNAHEETRLFLVVVNQPKNITAISSRQIIIS
jgi:hypothetical protein